ALRGCQASGEAFCWPEEASRDYSAPMTNNALVAAGMVAGGFLLALQPPINAALRGRVGVFESALISFLVGTIALVIVVAMAGKGDLLAFRGAPLWQLSGGLIGAVFVTVTLLAAPRLGVTALVVATLAGQVIAGLLIDTFGWFGIEAKPLEPRRLIGLALVGVAVYLMNSKD
ncbi:MAG TPA: DMT family transporter, partial [Salinarimonas sp.]|nr:DMT family transporter [Salinarimonas sp.]